MEPCTRFTITTELLKLKTGMPGVAIPLKSSNEMMLCIMSDQCLFSIADGPPAVPMIKGDKVTDVGPTLPTTSNYGDLGWYLGPTNSCTKP